MSRSRYAIPSSRVALDKTDQCSAKPSRKAVYPPKDTSPSCSAASTSAGDDGVLHSDASSSRVNSKETPCLSADEFRATESIMSHRRSSRGFSKVSFANTCKAAEGNDEEDMRSLDSIPASVSIVVQMWCKQQVKTHLDELAVTDVRGAAQCNHALDCIRNRVDAGLYDEAVTIQSEPSYIFKPFSVYRDVDKRLCEFQHGMGSKTTRLISARRERLQMMEIEFVQELQSLTERLQSSDVHLSDLAAVSVEYLGNVGGFFGGLYKSWWSG